MNYKIWDIETAPAPDSFLEMIVPEFSAPSNYRDPEKITASIAEQKTKWKERAALDATTARVLCIGVIDDSGKFTCMDGGGSEKQLLQDWTDLVEANKDVMFIGYSSNTFDLPMIVRRSIFHGVKPCVGWSWSPHRTERWCDLRTLWQLGDKTYSMGGLNGLAKFLEAGEKNGDGRFFSELWEADRDMAINYLANDCTMVQSLAKKMFII